MESPHIARLRSNAEAADYCARLRREERDALGAVAPACRYDIARYDLAVAIADAAQAQAQDARGKLIRALEQGRSR
jgi:hypothetical protein